MTRDPQRRAVRPAAPSGPDRGSATVELAVSMPALVLLLFAALAGLTAVRAQIECVDAARDAALAAARGDDGVAAGARIAPSGATIGVSDAGDDVRSSVSVHLRPFGPHLPGVDITATSIAAKEPSAHDRPK